jgi:uncharacterized membrane protein
VENTLHVIFIWMHILGIAMFVGPQFFLAFAWGPAAKTIPDQRTRVDLTRKLTRAFGRIGGLGLLLIIIAGSYLISTWRDFYEQQDADFTGIRYGLLFIVKMVIFVLMLAVVGLHTYVVGPRLVEALDAQANGRGDETMVANARKASVAASAVGLLLALAIMVLGVMMNTTEFSFQDV